MSGHNKWSQIKHKKASADSKKSREFGKLAHLLAVESKKSGGDKTSLGLAVAIAKAKKINMPKDNIDRAVARGTHGDALGLENVVYEAYGPGGAAIIIEAVTDNKNRTGADIRHLVTLCEGTIASPGAAIWAFEKTEAKWRPRSFVALSPLDLTELERMVGELYAHDDVQSVSTNSVPAPRGATEV